MALIALCHQLVNKQVRMYNIIQSGEKKKVKKVKGEKGVMKQTKKNRQNWN